MASSSSRGNQLFVSFYGPDFRPSFLSHFHKQLTDNGLTVFSGQGIGTTHAISPELTRAIRESRISIVVLSKNYASWGRCLDELVEIFKSEEDTGLTVMTFFYGVDPSDVRKQIGEFGKVFNETCAPRKEEERRIWSQALTAVGNIAGEHSLNWENPAAMFEKIARDVSKKLNAKSKSRYSTAMAFLVVINLVLEIGSVVADQLSSVRKPHLARISLVLSLLCVVLSILDLRLKVNARKASFQCKWPIPWFYYRSNRIFGSFIDTVLLFCVVLQLIVSTINYSYIQQQKEGPIKASIWAIVFAIAMLIYKFMEKPANSQDTLPITNVDHSL